MRRRWYELKHLFCMYDPSIDPKYDAAKKSIVMVHRMMQHLQINFELYQDPARDLSINEQTIGFQGRHKDKLQIMFKDSGDVFQPDAVCDCGYTYYLIYRNDDIPESKHYLCTTSERVIWILKRLKA